MGPHSTALSGEWSASTSRSNQKLPSRPHFDRPSRDNTSPGSAVFGINAYSNELLPEHNPEGEQIVVLFHKVGPPDQQIEAFSMSLCKLFNEKLFGVVLMDFFQLDNCLEYP